MLGLHACVKNTEPIEPAPIFVCLKWQNQETAKSKVSTTVQMELEIEFWMGKILTIILQVQKLKFKKSKACKHVKDLKKVLKF